MKKVKDKEKKLIDVFEELLPFIAKQLPHHGESLAEYPLTCQLLAELQEEYAEAAQKEQAQQATA